MTLIRCKLDCKASFRNFCMPKNSSISNHAIRNSQFKKINNISSLSVLTCTFHSSSQSMDQPKNLYERPRSSHFEVMKQNLHQIGAGSSSFENVHRVIPTSESDPTIGTVHWSPLKSAWITGMYLSTLVGGFYLHSWDSILLFLGTSGLTLCGGHSLGIHRRLIHNSFECPQWLEYLGVYLGTMVGFAGPYGYLQTHDMRDWAQRQPKCHPYFSHQSSFLKDAWWQLHCDLELKNPPGFQIEPKVAQNKFYQFLERTWMLQQIPLALLFYALGGWNYVVWGVCARVATCLTGHWFVGYFAHNMGHRTYHVEGAGIQGYNVKIGPMVGLITFGESWHNNHHAYPGSARIGIHKGEVDPGWWVLRALEWLGLVWNIKQPKDLPSRPELQRIC